MTRKILPVLCVLVAAGCGAESGGAATQRRSMSIIPGSCHEAMFEPVAGSQVKPVRARPGAPAALGVRFAEGTPATKRFDYVRIDVLPLKQHADAPPGEPTLLKGDKAHVRRFEASGAQLGARSVSFRFDGRDRAGKALAAGTSVVGFVVRTRSTAAGCEGDPAVKYGELTKVVWQPTA